MLNVSAKIKERFTKGLKKFQPILLKAQTSDINESDTVTIVTDILCDVFGYDKYENITSEFAIKKTFCDLAIKLENKVPLLIECKAIGIDLKDDHMRQATNYAADAGIEWVILTNGMIWRVYKIIFSKPIEKLLVYDFNFCELNAKKQNDIEMLYYLCIESFMKSGKATLNDFYAQKQILNKYMISQILMTDSVLDSIRKYMRKLYPEIKTTNDEILTMFKNDVLKREVIEGDVADEARKKVQKAERVLVASKSKKNAENA